MKIQDILFATTGVSRSSRESARIVPVVVALVLFAAGGVNARDLFHGATAYTKAVSDDCPAGWIRSSAPGGCSPGFFTLKLAGIASTDSCPKGWVSSSAPGGCSPGFFTLKTNGARDSRRSCPDGWVRSSAPGGCSPGDFTLEPGFDGIDQARYHCAFGAACDDMIEAVFALGGTCSSDGPDTTCDLPPLNED